MRKPLISFLIAAVASVGAIALTATASSAVDHETCRPDGLYRTPNVATPYCTAYDSNGREQLGAGHGRRVIGYFTGWRHGKNNQPSYLVNNIPWTKVTHINYAFAHVNEQYHVAAGTPATNMTWPGVSGAEMDPAYPYTGHFNLLNKYKKANPNVRTLISVGGWAETGGYFNDAGTRVDAGGFYRMTTTASNTVNTAGINTFADSVVSFLRAYGFNGVDIDYEYPTSNNDAGNPLDFAQANSRRAGLNASYSVLMKTLREKLDAASAADGRYYMLTVAAPASGWLLRGMEAFETTKYLDYINIMSYDLHGAWNKFVGPNAALYDNGDDAELASAGVYGAYSGIGYLNADWAYHYFRGSVQSGRINIGVPYYTRGWKNVTGGTNGLWGTAAKTAECPPGTQNPCGDGATGIDNLWHDLNAAGREEPAGSNPMWHAKNLENGIAGSYRAAYGVTEPISGTYTRHYSSALVAPWLWNASKRVFLSTEDEQSLAAKADYVVNKGLGGIMIWELAGDYAFNSTAGEYQMGSTLTNLLHNKFTAAAPYGAAKSNSPMPVQTLNVNVSLSGFALGDSNYPINPELRVTNNSATTIPGGAVLEFDVATSAPSNIGQQSGWAMTVTPGHTGSNVGGLRGDFHRVRLTLPSYLSIAPGSFAELTLDYKLPLSGPSNYTLTFGGQAYNLAVNYGRGGVTPTSSPTSSPTGGVCTAPAWNPATAYSGGAVVSYNGRKYTARWWTQGNQPDLNSGDGKPWRDDGPCGPTTSPTTSPSPSASPTRSPTGSPTPTATGQYPAWTTGVSYAPGARVSYQGSNYQCRQAHTSLSGWEPVSAPALWMTI